MAQSVELTPHQRQYLCKILAQLQMSRGQPCDPSYMLSSLNNLCDDIRVVCGGRRGVSSNIWITFPCKQSSSISTSGISQPPILQAQLTIPNRKLAKQSWPDPRGSWVLKFMFYYFLITFPGLSSAPKKYWTKVVQPCFDDVSSRYALIYIYGDRV